MKIKEEIDCMNFISLCNEIIDTTAQDTETTRCFVEYTKTLLNVAQENLIRIRANA